MSDITTHRSRGRQFAWELLRDSPTVRMLAMTAGGVPAELSRLLSSRAQARPAEGERDYYRRRSQEEHAAARNASGPEARKAHRELADLYSRLPRRLPAGGSRSGEQQARISKRQDALLDDALRETFPASDPVSVAWIH